MTRITLLLTFLFLLIGSGSIICQDKQILNPKELEPRIDELVQQYLDLDIFSGVVLVAEKGQPVYHKAFGLANREKNIPNTTNTKFDIGSMNKTFTKVVILQLVAEGKLQLSDKLHKYLEGFPKKITIDHLLAHSSGYGDYHSPDFFELPKAEKSVSALIKRIRQLPLEFEPGTEQGYSNAGYILLGGVIEKITGKTYQQSVKERIIKPLKLQQTYVEDKSSVPDRAIGYFKNMQGELMDNEAEQQLSVPNPDGGFQSTATDMLKFYREFHYGNKLLKEETKQLDGMFQFIMEHRNTGGAIPHAGGFPGANTVHFEILRDKISITVLANMDEPVAEQLGAGILAIVRGKEPKSPSLPAIQNVYQAYKEKGVEHIKNNFDELTVNFHPTDPRDLILNQVGYGFLSEGQVEDAIAIFTLNTELFPEVANVWDSLGEAWLAKGDKKKALEYYKKAMKIDPDMPSAQKMVKELSR